VVNIKVNTGIDKKNGIHKQTDENTGFVIRDIMQDRNIFSTEFKEIAVLLAKYFNVSVIFSMGLNPIMMLKRRTGVWEENLNGHYFKCRVNK